MALCVYNSGLTEGGPQIFNPPHTAPRPHLCSAGLNPLICPDTRPRRVSRRGMPSTWFIHSRADIGDFPRHANGTCNHSATGEHQEQHAGPQMVHSRTFLDGTALLYTRPPICFTMYSSKVQNNSHTRRPAHRNCRNRQFDHQKNST